MRRRLLNLLTALSLLLCMAVLVLWVRSYCVADAFAIRKVSGLVDYPTRQSLNVTSAGGGLGLYWGRREDAGYDSGFPGIEAWSRHIGWGKGWMIVRESSRAPVDSDYPYLTGYRGKFGFAFDSFNFDPEGTTYVRGGVVPHAAVIALSGVLPVLSARRWVRTRRRRLNQLCPRCAYDLRATPNRDPECGEASRAVR
jgi:hypothetical protein